MENVQAPKYPESERQSPVLIEQSAKKWKAVQLAGGIAIIVGLLLGMTVRSGLGVFGVALALVGIIAFVYGKIARWWHHG